MNFLIDGLKSWIIQRISAVFLVLFFSYLIIYGVFFPPADFIQWKNWFYSSHNQILFSCFFVLLLLHAWVGGRDVIFDYIKSVQWQGILLFALAVFLVSCAMWALQIMVQ